MHVACVFVASTEATAGDAEPEGEAFEPGGQLRREAECASVVTRAAEARHDGDTGAGK